jgi:hypothetical protein
LIDTEIAPVVNGSPFESTTTHRFSEGTDVTTQAPLRTNILKKITNVNMQEAEFRLHLHQKLINMDGVLTYRIYKSIMIMKIKKFLLVVPGLSTSCFRESCYQKAKKACL